MGKYTGCHCTICQNTFREEDDIVVCPDCGTPYHRSCYASVGHCTNNVLHESGISWQAAQTAHRRKIGGRECPRCHYMNMPDAAECASCRQPLGIAAPGTDGNPAVTFAMPDGRQLLINPADPCCGMPQDEEFEGEKLGDIARYVGTNTLYYIPLFKRFKETGKKLSLNFPCLFFPHLYLAYRRMWLPAILVMIVGALLNIPSMLASVLTMLTTEEFMESMQAAYSAYGMDIEAVFADMLTLLQPYETLIMNMDMVFYGIMLAGRTILGIFANWIYYRHVLKSVRRLRNRVESPHVAAALMQSEGGTSAWSILGALVLNYGIQFLVIFGIAFLLCL